MGRWTAWMDKVKPHPGPDVADPNEMMPSLVGEVGPTETGAWCTGYVDPAAIPSIAYLSDRRPGGSA